MITVVPPVVLDGDGDFEIYPTVVAACQSVEPDDVELFEVFDSVGHRFVLVPNGMTVSIEERADSRADPAELERRLRSYLHSSGLARFGFVTLDDASLALMLGAVLSYQRGEKPRKVPFWRGRRIGSS